MFIGGCPQPGSGFNGLIDYVSFVYQDCRSLVLITMRIKFHIALFCQMLIRMFLPFLTRLKSTARASRQIFYKAGIKEKWNPIVHVTRVPLPSRHLSSMYTTIHAHLSIVRYLFVILIYCHYHYVHVVLFAYTIKYKHCWCECNKYLL